MAYSEKVIEHYTNPRNVGSFAKGEDNVGTGVVGAPVCGDAMKSQLKLGRETRVAEQTQDLGVSRGRRGLGVDQVQLHLEPDPALGGLHRPVPQHQR